MAHIHDAIDFVVSAYVVHDSKVLMILHKKLGKWLPLGGHIELDEDPELALFREIEEESGLRQADLTVMSDKPSVATIGTKFLFTPNFLDIHDISPTHKHVGLIYLVRSSTAEVELAPTEHDGIRWMSKQELDAPEFGLSPAIKNYAQHAIAKAMAWPKSDVL